MSNATQGTEGGGGELSADHATTTRVVTRDPAADRIGRDHDLADVVAAAGPGIVVLAGSI